MGRPAPLRRLDIAAPATITIAGAQQLRTGVTWEYWGKVEGTEGEGWQRLMASAYREPLNLGQDRLISINGLADIKGKKVRVQEDKILVATFKALGMISTPIAFPEVATALPVGVATMEKRYTGEVEGRSATLFNRSRSIAARPPRSGPATSSSRRSNSVLLNSSSRPPRRARRSTPPACGRPTTAATSAATSFGRGSSSPSRSKRRVVSSAR